MTDIEDHYRNLLAEDYLTMIGDFDAQVRTDKGLLCGLDLECASRRGRALDLGAGPGTHSVALAGLGYHVTAVDLSEDLLQELSQRCKGLNVRAIRGDMTALQGMVMPGYDLAVCLGDTLSHLPSLDTVDLFLDEVRGALANGGQVLLGFRDLTQVSIGADRFLAIAQNETRIMTCFLEDHGEKVEVHDLIYRLEEGSWVLHKGSYLKLRLSEALVRERLKLAGFEIVHASTQQKQVKMMARKAT